MPELVDGGRSTPTVCVVIRKNNFLKCLVCLCMVPYTEPLNHETPAISGRGSARVNAVLFRLRLASRLSEAIQYGFIAFCLVSTHAAQ